MKKKLIYLLATFFLSINSFCQNSNNNGQGATQWKTNGNIADSNHFIGTKNESPVKFRTNDVERLRITPEGNIGLGTSQPEAKLDVAGSVQFRENLKFPGLTFSNGIGNDVLLIDPNGNVVKSSITELQNQIYSKQCPSDPFADVLKPVWVNGINKIFIDCPSVFVGIGTNSPRVRLDVLGTTYSGGLALGTADPTNMQGNFHMKVSLSPANTANIFFIESQQQELLKLNYQGLLTTNNIDSRKITINTVNGETPFIIQNASQKLLQVDQDGILYSRTVKVDVYDWPDFVFNEEYSLPTLDTVKDYISENGHLPNIPDAKTMEANGVDLGEMNKLLLQKIEELTLYLIEQDKRIEKLESLDKD